MASILYRTEHRIARMLTWLIVLSPALGASVGARAATMCVQAGDIAGLKTALAIAASNGEDDIIKLQAGQYILVASDLLDYEPSTEHHDLMLDGGYAANFGDPCGLAPTSPDPRSTVLDGGQLRLKMNAGATGTIALRALTVTGALGTDINDAPVEIVGGADATSNVTIDNVMFVSNGSTNNAPIYLFANQGALIVHDSLFASNISFAGINPVRLGSLQVSGSGCAEIINSTFANNASSVEAVELFANCLAIVANDLFWSNNGGDAYFAFPQNSLLANDDFANLTDTSNTQATNLLSVDPMFNPDYSIRDLSPLRNLGNSGSFLFTPGPYDVIGNPRTYGAKPDIGAFEIQDVIYAHGFDFQPPF